MNHHKRGAKAIVCARRAAIAVALAVLAVPAGVAVSSEPPPLRYTGHYEWYDGGRGRLDLTFFPDGVGGWEVTFRFDHARRFQTWKGSALGELGTGSLEGLAHRGRYRFQGVFEEGVFRGRHFEVRRSSLKENGTLTFAAIEERSKRRRDRSSRARSD